MKVKDHPASILHNIDKQQLPQRKDITHNSGSCSIGIYGLDEYFAERNTSPKDLLQP
jgi:hypothetical protein